MEPLYELNNKEIEQVSGALIANALGAIASVTQASGIAESSIGKIVELIERDMFKAQWTEWHSALKEVLAYLSAVQHP